VADASKTGIKHETQKCPGLTKYEAESYSDFSFPVLFSGLASGLQTGFGSYPQPVPAHNCSTFPYTQTCSTSARGGDLEMMPNIG